MLSTERALALHAENLLSEVLGFETSEIVTNAQGDCVNAHSGKAFLDFTGGIAVHACGHNHPEIVAAVQAQAADLLHISDIMRHGPQLELGRKLVDLLISSAPGTDWSVLFLNSGSESVDAAAKLALKATGKSKIVAFEGAFHGRTLFASALSRSKKLHWDAYENFLAPLRANIHHAPAPHCAGCELKRDICCANGLEKLLDTLGEDVAAVFFEPIQGEGGYFPMSLIAAQKIRKLTQERGILLVADEIQSGIGRTGKWFGYEHLGITPDIITFGKAVGGGLPLAGVAAQAAVMAKWQPGEHGTTFGGNPVSCAAGVAALDIIARDGLLENAARMGELIRERLAPFVGNCGVADIRGRGLMMAIEFRNAEGKPDYARCEAVKLAARENGLLLLSCGAKIGKPETDSAAVRLIPPLNITADALNRGLDILIAAIRQTA